jgi:hypothetical protein
VPGTNDADESMPDEPSGRDRVLGLLWSYRVSHAISAMATLGIADLIGDETRESTALAAATRTDEPTLYRLLRTLAAAGLLDEDADRRFSLTELGRALETNAPGSVAAQAIFIGRPYVHEAFSHLTDSVRTGGSAFLALHGENAWEWRAHEAHESAIFDRAMAGISSAVAPALADAYDFSGIGTLVDVGGGSGSLLAAILGRNPDLRGVLFDQAHVVSAAPEVLGAAGVAERCEIVGGSFFESVPKGDAYLMKSILHDWDDESAAQILRSVRAAARPDTRLFVVEPVVGPPNEGLNGKLSDLHMLVMVGGRERSIDEWAQLFDGERFELVEARPVSDGYELLIAAAR